jgi:hypothetical protein
MSRLSSLFDDDGDGVKKAGEAVESSYKYLGLGQIVEEDDPAARLTYLDSSGNVIGLDRFGRVVDQIWKDNLGETLDGYVYGYDRAGNRLWKRNATPDASGLDELCTYDAIDRLKNTQRGTVTVTNGIPGGRKGTRNRFHESFIGLRLACSSNAGEFVESCVALLAYVANGAHLTKAVGDPLRLPAMNLKRLGQMARVKRMRDRAGEEPR